MLIEDILLELECRVIGPVAKLETALEHVKTAELDGALLDVNLRGKRSYEIADALAAKGLPYIFVTGYGAKGIDPDYADMIVVQKPFSRHNIAEALSQLFAK